MRYSTLVSLAALSAVAMLTAASITQAAEKNTNLGFLKPQGKWQVGTVAAQAGEAPYCAMMGQFSEEAVLALSRSTDGRNSIAVDFHGGVFQPEKEYAVTLRVDDEKPRSFSGRASSNSSVVVQSPRDEDRLYNSLNRGEKIKVDVSDITAVFSLHKFSSSYASLLDCVNRLQPVGPKTAAVPVIAVEKTLLTSEDKSAERQALIQRMTVLQKDNAALQAQLADATNQQVQKYGELARVLSGPWSDYEGKMKAVETERDALKKTLSDITADKERITESFEAVQKERHALETRIASMDQQEQDMSMHLAAQDKQVKALQAALAALKATSAADKQKRVDVQAELDILKPAHASVVSQLREQIREKTTQYDELKKAFKAQSDVLAEVSGQAELAGEALNKAMQSHVPMNVQGAIAVKDAPVVTAPLKFKMPPSAGGASTGAPYEPDTVLIQ